jgi:hypothetical protein
MSDYRNSEFGNDPLRRDPPYDPDARAMNATWGWIAAAVFIVIGHEPNTQTAANNVTPPAATRMAPPLTPASPTAPPAATPAPASPTPDSPAAR